eukprot:scpid50027/ scgid34120/ Nuclear factor related to kappa-B-binding protein; DNA-binding protein R kappa-B
MPQFCEGETMEECLFDGDKVLLPTSLVCRADVFKDVLSYETWKTKLTSDERASLSHLLPKGTAKEQEKALRELFSRKNVFFGSPLDRFQEQLAVGDYSPDVCMARDQAISDDYKDYQHRTCTYFRRLVEDLMVKKRVHGIIFIDTRCVQDSYNHASTATALGCVLIGRSEVSQDADGMSTRSQRE